MSITYIERLCDSNNNVWINVIIIFKRVVHFVLSIIGQTVWRDYAKKQYIIYDNQAAAVERLEVL